MPSKSRFSTRRSERSESRPSARWLPAAGLAALGVAGLAVGLFLGGRDRTAESQSALALANLHTQVQTVRSRSAAALLGEPAASSELADARTHVSEDWQLLQKGGPLRTGDRVGARPLAQIEGLSTSALDAALASLTAALDPFSDTSRGLDAAATVIQQAPAWERSLSDTTLALRKALAGSPAPVVDAVAADAPGISAAALVAMFPPSGAIFPAQAEWVDRWAAHAQAAASATQAAVQAPGASAAIKTAWNNWLTAVNGIAVSAKSIASAQQYRATAQAAWPTVEEKAIQVDKAVNDLQQALDVARVRWLWEDWLAIASAILTLAGLLWWARMTWSQTAQQWALSQDHRSAQESQENIDHLSRRLRKILNRDGQVSRGERLEEDDPSSVTFALTAMINRVLESREQFFARGDERLSELRRHLEACGHGNLTERAEDAWTRIKGVAESLVQSAGQQAVLGVRLGDLRAHGQVMLEFVEKLEATIQEGLLHTDELRSTLQANSKRLKRLGESSQNVKSATDIVRETSRRIHVHATNAAIAASSLGNADGGLGALVQEIDRLSQGSSQGAQDIDSIIKGMQDDTQETVAAMEENTSDLVKGSQASNRALALLRDHVKQIKALLVRAAELVTLVENEAMTQSQSSKRVLADEASVKAGMGQIRRADDAIVRSQEVLATWQQELYDGWGRV